MLELRRLATSDAGFSVALERLLAFEGAQDATVDQVVAGILAEVRERGDAAVLDCTRRFDR